MRLITGAGLLLIAVSFALVYVAASPHRQQETKTDGPNDGGAINGLLDFANYKRLFKKSYSGLVEEAVRLKYFTASALQTAAAAIKYRFRLINHYLSLNHMSDWTREEFEKLKNKAFAEWARSVNGDRDQQPTTSTPGPSSPKFVPGDNEDVVQEVRELVDEHKGEPVYEQLGELLGAKSSGRKHERKKRETSEDKPLPPRDLPIEKLVNVGDTKKSANEWDENRLNVASNNPEFVPAELSTQGFEQTHLPVVWHSYESHGMAIDDLEHLAYDIDMSKVQRMFLGPAVVEQQRYEPDQVFIDLRQTGCIPPVRYQYTCGSCYAFSMTSIMSYLYCMNTGKRVEFSEQYVVDCGKQVGLHGCDGGNPLLIPHFVRNFGLYPAALYPYRNNEGQCPYDEESVDLRQTGFIRSDDFANNLMISREFWGEALKHQPLMIGVISNYPSDIYLYGGGIIHGNCEGPVDHVVVLIGHGRQDGREYWLIRNSWGDFWGEGGYFRIDKESNCIKPSLGFAYGVSNLAQFNRMTFVDNTEAMSQIISNRV